MSTTWTNKMIFSKQAMVVGIFIMLFGLDADARALQVSSIEVIPIVESSTQRNFELYVKLPENYEASGDKVYPVIYIADALWHIEIISGTSPHLLKDAILVGVSWEKGKPEQQSRMRDYMPNAYEGKNYDLPTGMAKEHLTFWANDVFKYIENNYQADPLNRSFFGYSVSATFGSYILLTKPNMFKNYILGSPETLFDNHLVHEYEPITKKILEPINANVFISVGAIESLDSINHAASLAQYLRTKKSAKSHLKFTVFEAADHGTAFPIFAVKSLYWLAEISQ
jgi:predicted alpha/beta superfamily hydrolase